MPTSNPSKLPFDDRETVKIISAIVGLVLLFFGLYMIGPWYVVVPNGAFAEASQMSTVYFRLVAGAHIIAGVGMVKAAFRRHNFFTRAATVLGMSMFSVMIATRLITIGLVPTIWVLQLGLMLIAATLALRAEGES